MAVSSARRLEVGLWRLVSERVATQGFDKEKGSGRFATPPIEITIRTPQALPKPASSAQPPPPARYCTVLFFFGAGPASTGFGASSFRSYFASDVLTVAALAKSALASDSTLGASAFASA